MWPMKALSFWHSERRKSKGDWPTRILCQGPVDRNSSFSLFCDVYYSPQAGWPGHLLCICRQCYHWPFTVLLCDWPAGGIGHGQLPWWAVGRVQWYELSHVLCDRNTCFITQYFVYPHLFWIIMLSYTWNTDIPVENGCWSGGWMLRINLHEWYYLASW